MTRRQRDDTGEVARVMLRLAVLLSAGVAPASAWRHVAAGSVSAVPSLVVGEADVPAALAAASADRPSVEGLAWRGLAAAWSLAQESGAPLGPALRAQASALRDLAEVQRDVEVALAGPVATTRIVAALPVVGVLFGTALGFDTVGTLVGTPAGWACLVGGTALAVGAWAWMRRLVAAAGPTDAAPGLGGDLLVIALGGGAAPDRAREALDRAAVRFGLSVETSSLDGTLALATAAGVPAAELLRAEAQESRHAARTDARVRAAALSSRLMLPLGLGVLPAFVLVGIVPLVLAVVSSTTASW